MFMVKDWESFVADVRFVKTEAKAWTKVQFLKGAACSRVSYETHSYEVTEWVHPTYTRVLAMAKDGSHTVTWSEISGEIHRW